MKYTDNYNLRKPEQGDFYDIDDQNSNMEAIDGALNQGAQERSSLDSRVGELEAPTFEDYTGNTTVPAAATALENIKSKSKIATLLGNIKAFCKGCVTLAMIVNNCVSSDANKPLSAAQGKVLMDLYTSLSSDLNKIKFCGMTMAITPASPGVWNSQDITFPTAFNTVPAIIVQAETTAFDTYVYASNATKTGFKLNYYRSGSVAFACDILAIGREG